MIKAAGILIVNHAGQCLLLKRGNGGDYPGAWCFPGGRLEGDETEGQGAKRECLEETGQRIGKVEAWTRRISGSAPLPPSPEAGALTAGLPPTLVSDIAEEQVDFTTFIARDIETFIPKLNDEHTAFVWCPPGQAPEPLHPGCRIALAKLVGGFDELHIAEAMRDGELTSPQRYENVTLFALRITGTELSYRAKHKEYVWRDKALYLNPRFLARCNGLPVIWEHPEGNTLNSTEYSKRNIGSILLPYYNGEEVWGIAKIYDAGAIKVMTDKQLSTSPAVVWRGIDANEKVAWGNDETLLIEGTPSLLDHLAICERGVWDKGEEPTGVLSATVIQERDDMSTKRNDGESDELFAARILAESKPDLGPLAKGIEAVTEMLKSTTARLDAMEDEKKADRKDAAKRRSDAFKFSGRKDGEDEDEWKKRGDKEEEELRKDMMEAGEPEESAVDKAKRKRKDAEEDKEKKVDGEESEEEKKAKADKARKDEEDEKEKKEKEEKADALLKGSLEALRQEVLDLKASTKPLADADIAKMTDIQARYDSVYSYFGKSAPRFLQGETELGYARRLAEPLQMHSKAFKDADLVVAAVDANVWSGVEKEILHSAMEIAKSPASVPENELRAVTRRTDSGHSVTEFFGDTHVCWDEYTPTGLAVKGYRENRNAQGSR